MSMETAGLALGSISLLGQVLSCGVKVLEGYHEAKVLGEDAMLLQVNLEVARALLKSWGTQWRLEEGAHLRHPRFQEHSQIAMKLLVCINFLLFKLSGIKSDIPIMNEAAKWATEPVLSLARLTNAGGVTNIELDAMREKIQQLQVNASFAEKIRWILGDNAAMDKVKKIKEMIIDLHLLLPPPNDDSAASLVVNKDLGSNDENKFKLIIGSSMSDTTLASLATLKCERFMLERNANDLRSVNPSVSVTHLTDDDRTSPRRLGTFFDRNKQAYPFHVLIEEKVAQNDPQNHARMDAQDHRFNSVARLLAMDSKPPELRTLHCLGVVRLGDGPSTTYKLLYKLPASNYFSLEDMLSANRKLNSLPLGAKFSCAKVLARAVLYLHLAGWFHKGIRSNNIIFAADDREQVDLAEPYICGFEYSRQTASTDESESVDADAGNNLFRHPDVQGPPDLFRREYRPAYDVYGLGMVLLELGHHRPLDGLKAKYVAGLGQGQQWTAGSFRAWIIQHILPAMVPKMGQIYVNVVTACLDGLVREDGRSSEETLFLRVVKELDQCRA